VLAIGAHAGQPSRRVLLGSTTLDAMSRATCPVAILPILAGTTERPPTDQEVHHVGQ
jgi:hypothetical protein